MLFTYIGGKFRWAGLSDVGKSLLIAQKYNPHYEGVRAKYE